LLRAGVLQRREDAGPCDREVGAHAALAARDRAALELQHIEELRLGETVRCAARDCAHALDFSAANTAPVAAQFGELHLRGECGGPAHLEGIPR
jgi:hypothetical protein